MSWVLSTPPESLVLEVLQPEADASGEVLLRYRLRDTDGARALDLTERVTLPSPAPGSGSASGPGRTPSRRLLRLLALAAAPSYYKTCVPATIAVPDGLTPTERRFLTEVIGHGLGEFAYRNDVPRALRPRVEAPELPEQVSEQVSEQGAEREATPSDPVRPLVAVGGGKDSIVTIEALRATGVTPTLFSVNSYAPIEATATAAGLPLVTARRTLDPTLFELNAAGALNGHVPVTAVNSVVGLLTAERLGLDAVVFSNEGSSSFGNVVWEGIEVNHQWSKGIDFERLLVEASEGTGVRYLSFLRPLTELAIMRRFGRLRDYHQVFTSCNRAFHLDPSRRRLWCGECPKCHFVFLCLSPFVPRADLEAIFGGRDLFADPGQREGFLELLNADGRMKPFECVGEPDECRAALTLTSRNPEWAGHPFLADPEVTACLVDEAAVEAAFTFGDEHLLPASYERAARAVL